MLKKIEITADVKQAYNSKRTPDSIVINSNDFDSVRFSANVTLDGSKLNLEGANVKLAIRKPDKKVTYQSGSVEYAAGGYCSFVLASQSYELPGLHTAEIVIQYATGEIIVTRAFPFIVERGILNDSAVDSTNWFQDIHNLSETVESLEEATELIKIEVAKALQETEEARQVATALNQATTEANQATTEANQAATAAKGQAEYAKEQAEYAKEQGDYIKQQIESGTGTEAGNEKIVWNNISMLNDWKVYEGFPAQYTIEKNGFVNLRGAVKGGASEGTVMFNLPIGFRPKTQFMSLTNGSYPTKTLIRVAVQTTGDVLIFYMGNSNDNTFISLDGVRFSID